MTGSQILAILPLIMLGAGAIVVLLQIAIYRHHGLTLALTLLAAAAAVLSVFPAAAVAPITVTPLLRIDAFALFFITLISAITAAAAAFAYGYLRHHQDPAEELYVLLLSAGLGAAVLTASIHFASLLLGLEILSASLFGLVAYPLAREKPLEAAIKYLILAGVSSAFLLFGMALVYAETGTMTFADLALFAGAFTSRSGPVLFVAGVMLILTGIGFKLSLVPFHMWAPDVYEGAPAPITGFLATASKAAVFALLLRYVGTAGIHQFTPVWVLLAAIAIASILVGNLLALLQDNVKRLLAYSSIAHLGYLMVPLLAAGALGTEAAAFYLLAYTATNLGAFGVVSLISEQSGTGRDADRLNDYRGLFWQQPWLAGVLLLMLLSLAGLPFTAGFIAKFYAVAAGVADGLWVLVVALIIGSTTGLFYYLRFAITLFARDGVTAPTATQTPAFAGSLAVAVLGVLLIWWGVFPTGFMEMARSAAAGL